MRGNVKRKRNTDIIERKNGGKIGREGSTRKYITKIEKDEKYHNKVKVVKIRKMVKKSKSSIKNFTKK